mgnify:CR=1 FL=1
MIPCAAHISAASRVNGLHTGGTTHALLRALLPYVRSFAYLGIYCHRQHHLLHVTQSVNGAILWANLHLLFWLSLVPFVTGWMGENQETNSS